MEGVIVNFRGSYRTQYNNEMIVKVSGYDNKEKSKELVGKKVTWKTPSGKEMTGVVKAAHGSNGALRVKFEKGLPGQALGAKVSVD